jgi:hypothetical protein
MLNDLVRMHDIECLRRNAGERTIEINRVDVDAVRLRLFRLLCDDLNAVNFVGANGIGETACPHAIVTSEVEELLYAVSAICFAYERNQIRAIHLIRVLVHVREEHIQHFIRSKPARDRFFGRFSS